MILEFKTKGDKYLGIDTFNKTYARRYHRVKPVGVEIKLKDMKELIKLLKWFRYKELDFLREAM